MIWRATTLLVTAFWLVMTFLLVRLIYYPDGSIFGKVPPSMVLKLFMEQGASLNTLHVYHEDTKIGFAAISTKKVETQRGRPDKVTGNGDRALVVVGTLDKGAVPSLTPGQVAWQFDLNLGDLSQIKGSSGQIRIMDAGLAMDYQWSAGEKIPRVTLKQHGVVIGDEKSGLAMAQMFGLPDVNAMLPDGMANLPAQEDSGFFKVNAREGGMTISGQKRSGYVLEMSFLDQWHIKAFFTEAGELALVELPEGFRLMEPNVHGLQPDFDDTDLAVPEL